MNEETPKAPETPSTTPSRCPEGRRRRRGGRALVALLVLVGVFMAGQAFAGRRNPSDEAIRDRVSWALEKGLDRIDGTDEQLAALETIVDAHFPTALTLRKEARELRMKLAEAILSETPDKAAIEGLRKQLVGLFDRATLELSTAVEEGTGVLTAEQRKVILDKISARFAG